MNELEKVREKIAQTEAALKEIRELASRFEWEEIANQTDIYMVSFLRNGTRMNIYYSRPWRLTIATTLSHPYKGRRQLFRKYVTMNQLETIMWWPRVHTGKGYYTK